MKTVIIGRVSRWRNRAIATAQSLRFFLVERLRLPIARLWHSHKYSNTRSETPLVSVIIATYNRAAILIDRTIPALLSQSYKNIEIIIVGDCCIDDTALRLSKIHDSRIRFYDLPERGKYPSQPAERWFVQGVVPRNKGLELARGQWLMWISDDDVLMPNGIETLVKFAQSGDYEFVSASYTYEKDGVITVHNLKDVQPRIGGMQTWLYRSYLRFFRWNIHSWRKSWNKPCDYDLQVRMHSAGVRMGFIDTVVAHIPATAGTSTVGLQAQLELAEKGLMP